MTHTRRALSRTGGLALALLLATPASLHAHPGRAAEPHDLWHAWSFHPAIVAGAIAGLWLYLRGVRRIWVRAGRRRVVARWRVTCWIAGVAAIAVALLSPIDALGDALFAAHMVQHLMLMLVAAPLLALGAPLVPMLFALPLRARRRVGRWWRSATFARAVWRTLTRPAIAWLLHVTAVIAWHTPNLYDAAERSVPVHVLEHVSFLATALLFWWVLFDQRARHRMRTGPAVLYLFAATIASTLLGAAITLARHPWYTAHWGTTAAWGFTPLEDQQLAGLIMWIPGGIVYLIFLAPVLVNAVNPEWPGGLRLRRGL